MGISGHTLLKPGFRISRARREELKNELVAMIEAAARDGKIAPTYRPAAKTLKVSEKTSNRLYYELREEGRITWHTVQTGPKGLMRVITVKASGLTTATPEQVKAKPRAAKPKFFQIKKKPPKLDYVGISDRQIYGPIEYAVKILRHRGFVVFKEGNSVRVGSQLLSPWQVEQKAARERRLMGEV